MKRTITLKILTISFVLITAISLISCNSKKPYEKIIDELTEKYGTYVTGSNIVDEKTKVLDSQYPNGDVLGDGTIFYTFMVIGDNYLKEESNIKSIVDKHLETLPKSENKEHFSEYCKCLMSTYKWETIEVEILMENELHTINKEKPYINSKIWINVKNQNK